MFTIKQQNSGKFQALLLKGMSFSGFQFTLLEVESLIH